jgi:hypothetical protein
VHGGGQATDQDKSTEHRGDSNGHMPWTSVDARINRGE